MPEWRRQPSTTSLGNRRHIAGLAVAQGQAVQMTAVFHGQFADERRQPERLKTALGAERGQELQAVAAKTTRPESSTAISWISRSPVV